MKCKINSKFNIKIHNQYKNMIFIGFKDIDLGKKKKPTNQKKKRKEEEAVEEVVEEEPKNPQISSFPHDVGGFELTIGANRDQVEEEEAVEDEDKEEAALIS